MHFSSPMICSHDNTIPTRNDYVRNNDLTRLSLLNKNKPKSTFPSHLYVIIFKFFVKYTHQISGVLIIMYVERTLYTCAHILVFKVFVYYTKNKINIIPRA